MDVLYNDTLIHKREANVVLWSVEKRNSVRNSEYRGSNWISMPETKELAREDAHESHERRGLHKEGHLTFQLRRTSSN